MSYTKKNRKKKKKQGKEDQKEELEGEPVGPLVLGHVLPHYVRWRKIRETKLSLESTSDGIRMLDREPIDKGTRLRRVRPKPIRIKVNKKVRRKEYEYLHVLNNSIDATHSLLG